MCSNYLVLHIFRGLLPRFRSISRVAPKFRTTRAKTKDHIGQKMADFSAGIFFLRVLPSVDPSRLWFQKMNEAHLSRPIIENWIEAERSTSRMKEIECRKINKRESWRGTRLDESRVASLVYLLTWRNTSAGSRGIRRDKHPRNTHSPVSFALCRDERNARIDANFQANTTKAWNREPWPRFNVA